METKDPRAASQPLRLIGAGLGRTGTASLRTALNDLGVPCYHMFDLGFGASRVANVAFWNGVAQDASAPDWQQVFGRYGAVLDYPTCFFYRHLMEAYPGAKVILTRHPKGAEAWYDSTLETIHVTPDSDKASDFGRDFNRMMDNLVWGGFFQGRFKDREWAIAQYEAHNQAVCDHVPPERLVDYNIAEGWGPLCAALDIPVPDRPFPNSNSRAEMSRRIALLERMKAFDLGRGKT